LRVVIAAAGVRGNANRRCKARTLSATKVVLCEPSAKRRMLREELMNAAAVQIILVTLTFFTFVMAARSGLTSSEQARRASHNLFRVVFTRNVIDSTQELRGTGQYWARLWG
jgi:hypothetical protein